MSQPDLLFLSCTSTCFDHITLWVLYKPLMKVTGGISDVFVYVSCRLEAHYPRFLGRVMCLVLK